MEDYMIWVIPIAALYLAGMGFAIYKIYLKWKGKNRDENGKTILFRIASYTLATLAVAFIYIPILIGALFILESIWGGQRCEGFCEDIANVAAMAIWVIPIIAIIKIKPFFSRFLEKRKKADKFKEKV